jgi:hypothetical protein
MDDIDQSDSRQRRKQRNHLFRAVQDGAFDDIEDLDLDIFPQSSKRLCLSLSFSGIMFFERVNRTT